MKKISLGLTKSAAWIAAGLIIGAGVGTGVGFLVINLSKDTRDKGFGVADSTQDKIINDYQNIIIQEYPTNNLRESIFGSKTTYTLSDNKQIKIWDGSDYKETNSKGLKYSVVDLGLYTLAYKIKTRLGFGPEIARLKTIKITPEGNWSEANGVYFGGSNEIIINSTNIIEALNRAKSELGYFSPEQEIEFVSEYVFQIISHEYNHHIAYTYLNSRFQENSQPVYFNSNPQSVDVKNSEKPETENWDKDFYDTFVNTLNYDGHDVVKDKEFWYQMQFVSNQQSNDNTITYTPITKYFTSSDIFKYANDKNVTSIAHKAGYGMSSATWNNNLDYAFYFDGPVAVKYTQESFLYNYSLAELFARKVQQLTMPIATNFEALPTSEEYPIPRYRGVKLEDNGTRPISPADNEVFGIDQLVWGSAKGTYSPFILDTKNYADDWKSIPFTSDYLYSNKRDPKDPTKIDPKVPTDYSNAEKIYTAILQEMGYSGNNVFDNTGHVDKTQQADISTIWWKNGSNIKPDGTMYFPMATSEFNMGGFVNDKNIKSIGYMDGPDYEKLADVKVNNFAYGMKKTLISSKKYPLNYTESTSDGADIITNNDDNYFWTLDDYHYINEFIGRDLVFETIKTEDEIPSEIQATQQRKIIETSVLAERYKNVDLTTPNIRANERPNGVENNLEYYEAKINDTGKQVWTVDRTFVPLTTYNSEATTWLSSDSQGQRTGINEMIARPHYGTDGLGNPTYGIRLQLFDKDNKEVK